MIQTKLESLCNEILESSSVASISISSIMARRSFRRIDFERLNETNQRLDALASRRGWRFNNNDNIDWKTHICNDGLHLNNTGIMTFTESLIRHIYTDPTPQSHPRTHPQPRPQNSIAPPTDRSTTANGIENTAQFRAHNWDRSYMYDQYLISYTQSYTGCFNCGEKNHKRIDCRYNEKLQCYNCYQYGHKTKSCLYQLQQAQNSY